MAAVGTVARVDGYASRKVTEHKLSFVSDGAGAVSGHPIDISGKSLLAVEVVPDGGATQPDALFDVTLVDPQGYDYLAGGGANLANAAPKRIIFDPPVLIPNGRTLDLVVGGAGAANGGDVYLWVE